MAEQRPVLTLDELRVALRNRMIFECISGSHAYGTNRPGSDRDIRGIYVQPPASLVSMAEIPVQVQDERNDVVFYSLRRFLELALNANPNIIELLYTPDDCILSQRPCFEILRDRRHGFLSKRAYDSHVRYAQAQIRKARGQNKWVNNPQPVEPPKAQDFCWFVPRENRPGKMPLRPVSLAESGVDLSQYHASSLEHTSNSYRVYHYGPEASGVFRGDMLVCEPIPIEDEHSRCIGLLIYNQGDHERAIRDHRNYWTWHRERNDQRWVHQESGQLDYDAKNMMHMFRLLLSARSILKHGAPLVRVAGEDLAFLMDVLNGNYTYEDLLVRADKAIEELDLLRVTTPLPDQPDMQLAQEILLEVTTAWQNEH